MGRAFPAPMPKVIVVEDNPTMLSFWKRILRELGIEEAVFFADPAEALKFIEETPCRLLISGVIMPSLNGYELAKRTSEKYPDANIVLATAYGTDLSRFDLTGLRFHLIHKPFSDISALKRFVKHLYDGDTSFYDLSDESSSENEDYPQVTEWKL